MALREPAGEKDVVCNLFIPLSVDHWNACCQDSYLHIFGYAKEGDAKYYAKNSNHFHL